MLSLHERLATDNIALTVPVAVRYGLGIVVAAGCIALAAHVRISLPFSPVPITLQTAAVLVGAMLVATALIYACGVVGLVATTGLSWSAAIVGGVLPFVPGDLLKVAAALGISRISIPAWSAWCRR